LLRSGRQRTGEYGSEYVVGVNVQLPKEPTLIYIFSPRSWDSSWVGRPFYLASFYSGMVGGIWTNVSYDFY